MWTMPRAWRCGPSHDRARARARARGGAGARRGGGPNAGFERHMVQRIDRCAHRHADPGHAARGAGCQLHRDPRQPGPACTERAAGAARHGRARAAKPARPERAEAQRRRTPAGGRLRLPFGAAVQRRRHHRVGAGQPGGAHWRHRNGLARHRLQPARRQRQRPHRIDGRGAAPGAPGLGSARAGRDIGLRHD